MIRNIIFDVGKVLVSYEPDAYMQRLGISKEKQKKINEAMFQNKLRKSIKPSEIPWNCSRMPWNGFSI